jgi:hypothetical protein
MGYQSGTEANQPSARKTQNAKGIINHNTNHTTITKTWLEGPIIKYSQLHQHGLRAKHPQTPNDSISKRRKRRGETFSKLRHSKLKSNRQKKPPELNITI